MHKKGELSFKLFFFTLVHSRVSIVKYSVISCCQDTPFGNDDDLHCKGTFSFLLNTVKASITVIVVGYAIPIKAQHLWANLHLKIDASKFFLSVKCRGHILNCLEPCFFFLQDLLVFILSCRISQKKTLYLS